MSSLLLPPFKPVTFTDNGIFLQHFLLCFLQTSFFHLPFPLLIFTHTSFLLSCNYLNKSSEAEHKAFLKLRSWIQPYIIPLNLPVSIDLTGNYLCLIHVSSLHIISLLVFHYMCFSLAGGSGEEANRKRNAYGEKRLRPSSCVSPIKHHLDFSAFYSLCLCANISFSLELCVCVHVRGKDKNS